MREASVAELLCHRVVWALLMLAALVWHQGQLQEARDVLRSGHALKVLAGSTVLIAINWGVYIFSVLNNRVLESSLGYYINPLVNVLLGVALLRERLQPPVWLAVAIASGGVLWLALQMGRPPWISLMLAFAFALYGLLRKIAPVGALIGLTVETLLLLPLAAGYLVWKIARGESAFLSGRPWLDLLLLLAGPTTAIPLLCFAAAARRLPLSTLGFLQYVSPTLQFLLAVFAYGEAFDRARAGAFACIWTALAIFAYHSARHGIARPVTTD